MKPYTALLRDTVAAALSTVPEGADASAEVERMIEDAFPLALSAALADYESARRKIAIRRGAVHLNRAPDAAHHAARQWAVEDICICLEQPGREACRTAYIPDAKIVTGMGEVAEYILATLHGVHGAAPLETEGGSPLDPAELGRRLRNLRVQISRNGGEAVMRLRYEAAETLPAMREGGEPKEVIRLYYMTASISRFDGELQPEPINFRPDKRA